MVWSSLLWLVPFYPNKTALQLIILNFYDEISFLPAAKRHGHGKLWVGIVVVLLLHQTIVSLVCFSFIFAMCVGILGQPGTVPKLSRCLKLANFTCFLRFFKKSKFLTIIYFLSFYCFCIFSKVFFFLFIPINTLKLYLRYESESSSQIERKRCQHN